MGPLNKSLTGKQKRVLDNIQLYINAKGEPPTLDELRQNLEIGRASCRERV